jgi:hypothetical protein
MFKVINFDSSVSVEFYTDAITRLVYVKGTVIIEDIEVVIKAEALISPDKPLVVRDYALKMLMDICESDNIHSNYTRCTAVLLMRNLVEDNSESYTDKEYDKVVKLVNGYGMEYFDKRVIV